MKQRTRTSIADALLLVSAVFGLAAIFFSGIWPFAPCLVLAAVSIACLGVAALFRPPFWWGNRTFTTPLSEPDHRHVTKSEYLKDEFGGKVRAEIKRSGSGPQQSQRDET